VFEQLERMTEFDTVEYIYKDWSLHRYHHNCGRKNPALYSSQILADLPVLKQIFTLEVTLEIII
jgi:hypothetical protein